MITPPPLMAASPLDRAAERAPAPPLVQLGYRPARRWVPSRYNARTVGDDGRLILWNTLSGAMNVFPATQRSPVLALLSPKGVAAPLSKDAEYLIRRGYLVRADASELDRFRVRFAQQQWSSEKLELILLATEDCNFRCVYCYEKFERGTMAPEVREGVRNLTLARAPHLKSLYVDWFGGEPLYGWEAVEELSPFFKSVADRHGIAQLQHMTTNAYLLTEERAAKLLSWGVRRYQITVDGLKEEHDCKRVGRDGSPTHDVILDNLRALKARPETFTVSLRINYDRDNFPRMAPFLEALGEDFAGDDRFRLRFRAVGKWGGPNDSDLNTCGLDERPMMRALQKQADDLGLARDGGVREISGFGSQVCYAARPYNFIVGASGTLMKCTIALYEMESNVVGQLHPDGSMTLDEDHMAAWTTPHFENDALCKHCYVLPLCQGAQCPLTRLKDNVRSCCSVKANLKDEMRFTLREAAARARPAPVAVAAETAAAGG